MIDKILKPAKRAYLTVCLLFVLITSGCSLLEIKKQTKILEGAGEIRGIIQKNSELEGPINVMVFEFKGGVLAYQGSVYTTDDGFYKFYVTPGNYALVAYIDSNQDRNYQDSEPASYNTERPFFDVLPGQIVEPQPITINNEGIDLSEFKMGKMESVHYANLGRVMSLDDPIFERENYALGLWKPMEFLEQVGGGLIFLEEYDPDKIPVLLIHGINGGPRDWESVLANLDTEAFQPIVYFYASGIQLDIVSETLASQVEELKQRLGFQRMHVVAHSMGGLVAWSFVKHFYETYSADEAIIDQVITINSPLEGMASATSGVKHSPIVVQSWRDVAEGSDFLADLHAWGWPDTITYHLVFSHLPGEASDGIVPLESQLPMDLQKEAVKIYGFINEHTGTLSDPEFLELLNRTLKENP